MNEARSRSCQQPGCDGPASGVCIEKFPLEECPHFVLLEDIGSEYHSVPDGDAESASADYVSTSLGATLDSGACDALLRRREARVLAVIAGPNAGKTTLLAMLYELARRRKLNGIEFAGSETILGFEERCHLSRAKSMLSEPDTQRTRVKGPRYLHLRLATSGRLVDLIMADRPGENFTKAIDNPAVLSDYEEVRRADHVLLLIDGKQLFAEPHPTIAAARRLFRGLIENGLRVDQHVHFVVTKVDLFKGQELADLRLRSDELLAEFQARAEHHSVVLRMTGVRTRRGEESFGEGVDELVDGLIGLPGAKTFQALELNARAEDGSMLNRLMHRMVAGQ